jgi:hypothetical protein
MVEIVPFIPRKQMLTIIRHECGHAVIGKAEGFIVGGLSLKIRSASLRVDIYPSLRTTEHLRNFAKRRIRMLYAGVLAETLNSDGTPNPEEAAKLLEPDGTAINDAAKARELGRTVVGFDMPDATPQDFEEGMKVLLNGYFNEALEAVNVAPIEALKTYCMQKIEERLRLDQNAANPLVSGVDINGFVDAERAKVS